MSAFDDDGNKSYKFSVTPDHFRAIAQPGGSSMRFSRTEITHILISVAVLTLAFAIVVVGVGNLSKLSLLGLIYLFGASFLAVASGFLLHELMHKRVAQGYGCLAEFRMYPMGLLMGLLTAVFGFLIVLPGAVMIAGRITKRENGIISAAGPLTNMLIGGSLLALALSLEVDTDLWFIVGIIAFINLWLAFFNLLPIPPLDGSKVFSWNVPVYLGAMATAVAMLAVFHLYMWHVI
jgi:Zn-dependent protease